VSRSYRRVRTADQRGEAGGLRVLRVSKSGVVTAWRERERQLRLRGADLTLVAAARWEEGGSMVEFSRDGDLFVEPVRTVGRHPNLFLYDPRPLWRLLGSGHWDLIDLHEEPFGLAVAEVLFLRWLRAPGVPFIFSSAQNIEKRYPPPFRWLERAALRRAAGAYSCNTEAGRILRRKGLEGEWALLPLGVDVERFRAPHREPPTASLSIGFVGRLIRHKGVDVLLGAVALDDRFTAEIFGAGPESERLTAMADALGISDRVRFHGHVDEERIPEVYSQVDVVAVPSVPLASWIEQFGRVVVEAQASGVPVVASASGALPDVVRESGLLVPPNDPVALHAALRRFLDEPGLWARLRESGMAEASRYSWESIADTQMALYRAVTSGPSEPSTRT
jgi:glycosyltransferase involved in cell wall biosynthesis